MKNCWKVRDFARNDNNVYFCSSEKFLAKVYEREMSSLITQSEMKFLQECANAWYETQNLVFKERLVHHFPQSQEELNTAHLPQLLYQRSDR